MASRMDREKNSEYKKFVGLKKASMQSFKEYLKNVEESFLNADLNSDKLLEKANTFLLNLKIPGTSGVETSTNEAMQEQKQQQSPDVTPKRNKKKPQDKKSPTASTSSSTSADIGRKSDEPVNHKPKKNSTVKKSLAKNETDMSSVEAILSTSTSSGTSKPASKPTQNWHPYAMKERRHFSVKIDGDRATPDVTDVKLLPGGLIVIADTSNCCVKLFNTQSRYIVSQKFDHAPVPLAVIDTEAKIKWEVGVSLPSNRSISILKVTSSEIHKLDTIKTQYVCSTLAAIDRNNLVVGYQRRKKIDKISMEGNVTLNLSPNIKPSSLAATVDGCKIMCTSGSQIVSLSSKGRELFKNEVSPIKEPIGITILRDKLIIADKKNLHLAETEDDESVTYIHKLWSLPDNMKSDCITSVSTDSENCVCSTNSGIVCVLDIVFEQEREEMATKKYGQK